MARIAIVEDDVSDLNHLLRCLDQYEKEHQLQFDVQTFTRPLDFLDAYHPDFDLIFLDIEMPHLNGMETARRIRQIDPVVTLVFITNMEQYAIKGYEVEALDFVVKPINYYRFSSMMRKALRAIERKEEKEVLISSGGSMLRLPISQIYYIEIQDHLLLYNTEQGRAESWGKLSDVEAELSEHGFARCSAAHLVNLRFVVSVEGNNVNVAGYMLPISQRRKKAFLTCVTRYLSGRP